MPYETLITDLQSDIKARIEADSYFTDVTVYQETDKALDQDIAKLIGAIVAKGGKRGICAIVEEPTATDDYPNVYGGPLMIDINILICEHVPINRDTANGGTGKQALAIARRLHRVLKHYCPMGLSMALVPNRPSIQPVAVDSILNLYEVRFRAQEADANSDSKVAGVVMSLTGGGTTITMTCATAAATIYYTIDGSHPSSSNVNSQIYTAPISVSGIETVRAAAYKSNMIASNVSRMAID